VRYARLRAKKAAEQEKKDSNDKRVSPYYIPGEDKPKNGGSKCRQRGDVLRNTSSGRKGNYLSEDVPQGDNREETQHQT